MCPLYETSHRCSWKEAEDLRSICTGVWYCGRECQLGGWKAGHKIDCCKQNASVEAALLELVEV